MIYNIFDKLNKIKKFPYFICTPLPYAVGTASEYVFVAVNQAPILGKKVIIIVPTIAQNLLQYKIFNNCYFNELEINKLSKKDKFLKYIFTILINIQFLFNRTITLFLEKFTNFKTSEGFRFATIGVRYHIETKANFDEIQLPQHTQYEVNLSDQANNFCLKKMEEMGINKDDNFVCVHVRDNAYKNDSGRRNQDYNLSMRNSDINNYKQTILYLLDKNYWVIRMGQSAEKKLEISHPKFIDYPFSQFKNHCLDLYLVKNCKFMICTQSGLQSLAMLFEKPVLTTNSIRIFESKSTNEFSRVISKKPFWKKNKKFITLENYLKLKYMYHHVFHVNNEIDFEENSSDEILEATKEFLESMENKKNNSVDKNQIFFNEFVLNSLKKHYYDTSEKDGSNLINVKHVCNLIINVRQSKEYYCRFFLKKYFKF